MTTIRRILAVGATALLLILGSVAPATAGVHSKYVANPSQVACDHSYGYEYGGKVYVYSHTTAGHGRHHAGVYQIEWWGWRWLGHWSLNCPAH